MGDEFVFARSYRREPIMAAVVRGDVHENHAWMSGRVAEYEPKMRRDDARHRLVDEGVSEVQSRKSLSKYLCSRAV